MFKKTITLRRYLKKLPEALQHIKETKFQGSGCTSLNVYFEDESRFGLLSIARRILTVKGVKPVMPYQHRFQNCYLFGAYSPVDGDHFTLELPKCNADCFQLYLDQFSQHQPQTFKIVFLDNGAFHKPKSLNIPPNIGLVFLPPYSPELNPAEKIWRYLKDRCANLIFKTLDELSDHLAVLLRQLKALTIKSITAFQFYMPIINDVL